MTCKKMAKGGVVQMPWLQSKMGMKKHPDMESKMEDKTDTVPEGKEKSKPKGFKPGRGSKSGCK